MLLNGRLDDEPDSGSPDTPTRAWYMAAGICLLPIYAIFAVLGEPGKGTAGICFGGAMIVILRLRWGLKSHLWFWGVVSLIALWQVSMVIFIPWPKKNYTLPIVLPVGILDALAMSSLIQWAAKKMEPAQGKTDTP
jgi:hypothetical protein